MNLVSNDCPEQMGMNVIPGTLHSCHHQRSKKHEQEIFLQYNSLLQANGGLMAVAETNQIENTSFGSKAYEVKKEKN